MNVDPPEDWERREYEGKISQFNVWEPLVSYEHRESAVRVVAKPVIDTVPVEESQLTVEDITDRFHSVTHPSKRRQTHWYRATQCDELPAALPDAPLTAERFETLPWRIAIQPVWSEPSERPDDYRPDTQELPVASFDCADRESARDHLRSVLDGSPSFRFYERVDGPAERAVPARRF